ncbi:F-box associated domain type 1 [Arabidopsis suecica]|uniref:F-box associated domain type 1 n=2 Tax=Arabidopsis TaxID=3701 RepID=A0A8T2H727_ARASU|nr:F-box and associated interaction domains-containing protein [Arabidopsis thaliana]AEE30838.1 F-box and associated interaction domains-containing protein [Arabidopsis thaliana]KAG7655655.1 F-box associated domain type 1 [Arabidopsis suecica]|eukprot:NP_174069.1 F-box and associated interaction domains-containing protein [Arabidopsis thaliana]
MEWSLPVDLQEEILSRVPAKSLARWKSTPKQWKGPISIEFLHLLRSTLKFPLLNLHLKSKSIYVTSFTAMVFCYAPPSTKDSRFGIHVQGKPSGFLADEQNKVVVCCKWRSDSINTIYFVGENKHVQVDQRRGDLTLGQSCSFLMNYVPSFVQIQQGTLLAPRT